MTTVVNLRTTKGKPRPKCDVKIDRSSPFGNPHTLGFCKLCNRTHDRIDCLKEYKIYFYKRLLTDETFRDKVLSLKGKVLGCWCVPLLCHGHVIIEYLEGISYEKEKCSNISSVASGSNFFE